MSPWTSPGPDGGDSDDGAGSDGADTAGDETGTDDQAEGTTGAPPPVDFDPAFVIAQAEAAIAAGVPGVAVAVVMDGQIVFAEAFGVADESGTPATADTLFPIGSISKSVTALTVLSQRDEGLLTLDTPVTSIVPGFVLDNFDASSVRVGHLLTHTSGLGDWWNEPYITGYTLLEEFTLNPNQPLWAPSGTVYTYSNRGYSLAGLVAATIDGTSFAESVDARVLQPLGMTQATMLGQVAATRPHARGRSEEFGWMGPEDFVGEMMGPSGGLWAHAQDLGRYVQAHATGEGSGLEAALAAAASPQQSLHTWPGEHYGYGLNVSVATDPMLVGHGGSIVGYTADMLFYPELGFGVIAAVNTLDWYASDITYPVLEHYAGPVNYVDGPDTSAAPASLPGTYHDPWQLGTVVVSSDGAGLTANFADFGQTVPLEDLGGGSFMCPHPIDGWQMAWMFWPDAAGNAAYFVSRGGIAARQ
jgi:CubicO group peptidase (beta-lactamase class C family)